MMLMKHLAREQMMQVAAGFGVNSVGEEMTILTMDPTLKAGAHLRAGLRETTG